MEAIKLFTPEQIKDIDKKTIDEFGIPELLLMENAAYGVFSVIKERFSSSEVIVICGPGNNGGDGMATARLLSSAGYDVKLSFISEHNYHSASLINYNLSKHIKRIPINKITTTENTLILDAIFGIGLNRPIDKTVEKIILDINNSKCKVLSIDIPSGVNAETGMGITAIQADITVTICTPKIGMYLFPGHGFCGDIIVSEISTPISLFKQYKSPVINSVVQLPSSDRDIHKTSEGVVLSIAGSKNYFGAPYLTSKAALLSGCGYSILASDNEVIKVCATLAPEVIYIQENNIINSLERANCVVIGPGLGLDKRAKDLLNLTIQSNPKVLIIDGDALTLLSENPDILQERRNTTILTPHLGEASRLLKTNTNRVSENLIQSTKQISHRYNSITVLKGAHSIIHSKTNEIFLNINSSKTLATAGSGDVLCGIISALCGKVNPIEAVRAGVYIHGLCGIILEEKNGDFGSTSTDILNSIPQAINRYLNL